MFSFEKHPEHPELLAICKYTGVLKYLPFQTREYGDTYFQEEYKSQYKKTYYEDEPNLRTLAKRRLDLLERSVIKNKLPNQSLLEIGCSAGFFLDEAKNRGFVVEGIELSTKEAEYAKTRFQIPVVSGSFLDIPWERTYGVLALFFVLEHLEDQKTAWEKIASLIEPGGALLLAIPSFYGPLFQTQRKEWFRTHPADHHFDYDPKSLKKVLTSLGFNLEFQQPMSYHPRRDLGLRGMLPDWLYRNLADLFCYGDTFQLIARKNH